MGTEAPVEGGIGSLAWHEVSDDASWLELVIMGIICLPEVELSVIWTPEGIDVPWEGSAVTACCWPCGRTPVWP